MASDQGLDKLLVPLWDRYFVLGDHEVEHQLRPLFMLPFLLWPNGNASISSCLIIELM